MSPQLTSLLRLASSGTSEHGSPAADVYGQDASAVGTAVVEVATVTVVVVVWRAGRVVIVTLESHVPSISLNAPTSARSAVSPQAALTVTQSVAYLHQADASEGLHSDGSRDPLERLEEALTAARAWGWSRSLA